jgi:signal peptidase I
MGTITPSMEPLEKQSSPSADTAPAPEAGKQDGFFTEIVRFGLIALLVVLPIRMFIAQPFIVSGASMQDTFESGEYLIVDQVTYRFNEPERGDVVIFKYPKDPSKFFIKRIIGLPGDTVRISGDSVSIANDAHPNGVALEEPYIDSMREGSLSATTLKEGEYFVMGDNRDASSDSRVWGILPRENIVGRAYVRLFPLSKVDVLPGAYDLESTQ